MRSTGRIGYLIDRVPPRAERALSCELLEMERRGLPLHVFALEPSPDGTSGISALRSELTQLPRRFLRQPLRLLAAHLDTWRRYRLAYGNAMDRILRRRRGRALITALREIGRACCLIREGGPLTHLHVHGTGAAARVARLVGTIAGVPYSVAAHPEDLYRHGNLDSPELQRWLGKARFVTTDSCFSAERLRRAANGSAPRRIHCIYGGIDLEPLRARESPPGEPSILAVGPLLERRGFDDLVQACRLLRNRGVAFRCEIIGTGPHFEVLARLVLRLRLAGFVNLRGALAANEVREAFDRATLFVHPGRVGRDGDRDVLPDELKEAMSLGLPVLCSSLPGIEELVEHGATGFLHPPGDVERLADGLDVLLQNDELRDRLAAGGRAVIERRFDRRTSYGKLAELLVRPDEDPADASAGA